MPSKDVQIRNIQFKRGAKAVLEAKLVENILGIPADGEPIFESDTGRLKIGDGLRSYAELPYTIGDMPNFIIHDPLSDQVLLYDAELQAWVNKDLADTESIIYLAERGLTIKGYETAKQGYMLVKDETEGLTWVKPLDSSQLQQAVADTEGLKNQAGNYMVQAGNAASAAEKASATADRINQQTMNWVNNKFWWGSLEEYNALTSIDPGTFYFIRTAN